MEEQNSVTSSPQPVSFFFGDVVLLELLRLGSRSANGWSGTESVSKRSKVLNKRQQGCVSSAAS